MPHKWRKMRRLVEDAKVDVEVGAEVVSGVTWWCERGGGG